MNDINTISATYQRLRAEGYAVPLSRRICNGYHSENRR